MSDDTLASRATQYNLVQNLLSVLADVEYVRKNVRDILQVSSLQDLVATDPKQECGETLFEDEKVASLLLPECDNHGHV